MEARREAGPGALVAWWPRAPGSPVPPPSPASESPCFQLACTGMSRSSAFACSCGRGFCSDGADCGDPLAGGFANFIQFGPIAARDRGAVGSSLFNLLFLQTRPCVSAQSSYSALAAPFLPRPPVLFFFFPTRKAIYARNNDFLPNGGGRRIPSQEQIELGFQKAEEPGRKNTAPRSHTDSPAGLPRQICVCKRATFPTEEAFPRLKVGALFRRVSGCFIS